MSCVRSTLAFALLTTSVALAAPARGPWPATPRKISIEFHGPLKDALKKIASESGINLVVSGQLNEPVDVYLRGVTAEEALQTVASAYHLRIDQNGTIWTLRRMTEAERASAPPSAPRSPEAASPPSEPGAPEPSSPPAPPSSPTSPEEPDKSADSPLDQAANDVAQEIEKSLPHGSPPVDSKELRRKLKALEKKYKHRRYGKRGSGDRVDSGSVIVSEGETVNNCIATGGSVTVRGQCAVDAVALGGSVWVYGHVSGSAVAIGGSVHLGPNAVVEGDAVAIGGEIIKEEGAEIGGDQLSSANLPSLIGKNWVNDMMRGHQPNASHDHDGSEERISRRSHSGLGSFLIRFAVLFALGFLSMLFFPSRMRQIEDELKNEPLKCGVAGFVGILALIPLSILLIITLIGIPFAVLLWILVGLAFAMGIAAVANEIGMRIPIFVGRKTQALVLALGVLVLLVVSLIPIFGPLAIFLVTLLSFGAIIRTRFGQRPKGIPEPISSEPIPS